jgi:hypothetical protein
MPNLDPSQKMIAAGSVQNYHMNALTVDDGIQSGADWRRDLPGMLDHHAARTSNRSSPLPPAQCRSWLTIASGF